MNNFNRSIRLSERSTVCTENASRISSRSVYHDESQNRFIDGIVANVMHRMGQVLRPVYFINPNGYGLEQERPRRPDNPRNLSNRNRSHQHYYFNSRAHEEDQNMPRNAAVKKISEESLKIVTTKMKPQIPDSTREWKHKINFFKEKEKDRMYICWRAEQKNKIYGEREVEKIQKYNQKILESNAKRLKQEISESNIKFQKHRGSMYFQNNSSRCPPSQSVKLKDGQSMQQKICWLEKRYDL